MKTFKTLIIFFIFSLLFIGARAQAEEITLIWDANTEPDLAGYRLFQAEKRGTVSTAWQRIGETTETTFTLTVPDGKGFVFCVIAFDTSGQESFISNIALHNWKVSSPKNLKKQ